MCGGTSAQASLIREDSCCILRTEPPEAGNQSSSISRSHATDAIEKTGRPARFEVLQEMSKISRGRMVMAEKIDELVKEINALPEPQPLVTSIKLWAHWLAPVILITLLSLFWVGRKLNGAF